MAAQVTKKQRSFFKHVCPFNKEFNSRALQAKGGMATNH